MAIPAKLASTSLNSFWYSGSPFEALVSRQTVTPLTGSIRRNAFCPTVPPSWPNTGRPSQSCSRQASPPPSGPAEPWPTEPGIGTRG